MHERGKQQDAGPNVANRSKPRGERGPSPHAGPPSLEVTAPSGASPVLCLPGTDADRGLWAALGQDRSALIGHRDAGPR